MIRIERDPAFWAEIASHPAVQGAVMGLPPAQIAKVAMQPGILPLASENGGFFFGQMDAFGLVVELHTLFRPAGWGREAWKSGKEALEWVFRTAQVVMTHELETNEHSQPPRSFGFTMAGDWTDTQVGRVRLWTLTRTAWEGSRAYGRDAKCRSH